MPDYSEEQVFKILKDRKKLLYKLTMEEYFNGLLNKRVGNIIAKSSGIKKLSFSISKLNDELLKKMCYIIKNYELKINDTNGFNDKTLESKILKGVYCGGEILDVVGDCGGFNLQWAWSSAYVCSRECVNSMLRKVY